MIGAIIGLPGAGRRALAAALCLRRPDFRVIDFETLRRAGSTSSSSSALLFRTAVSAGELVPDVAIGQLLAEIVIGSQGNVLLLGYPRNLAQWEALRSAVRQPILIIHLNASLELIDARRHAAGEPPLNVAHPGTEARINSALQPVLSDALSRSCLLSLDAGLSSDDLATAVERHFFEVGFT